MRSSCWLSLSFALLAGLGTPRAWGATPLTRHPYPQSLGRDRVTFMWRTATPVVQAVEFGTNGFYNRSVADALPTTHHEVVLTELVPGTRYQYRVREGAEILLGDPTKHWFRTDGGPAQRQYSFFFTGDIGAEPPDAYQHLTQAMIRNVSPRADFGILCGDIIYPDGESAVYDERLMTPWRELLVNTTVWPCLGNHDWHVDPDSNFAREWALPNNEHYYSFDYGNAHFIALDTADGFLFDELNQLAWLRADLEAARGKYQWTFVYYHHPVLTCTYKNNIPEIAAQLYPLFEEFRVDMVFNGHAHTYERLYPIRAGLPVDQAQNPQYTDPLGTIYVVSGCGGKMKLGQPTAFCGPTAAFVDERIMFTQVFVYDQTLYLLTIDSTTGAVMDWMRLTKTTSPTDVAAVPAAPRLRQNVPNPFNPTTTVSFDVPAPGRVRLRVYRPDGTLVRELLDRDLPAGMHDAPWDGRDAGGTRVASGAYMCRMDAPGGTWSIKMMLVR